jgi:hypothetical protein
MTGTTPPISIMRGRLIALGIADHAFSPGNTSMLEVSDAFTNLMKLRRPSPHSLKFMGWQ